ncbi:nucleotidyltransferase domain-containing protein [Sinimarinibacterium flocculans]|uniref:Nucleotidyltransferase n=1 Tax=Sinimarinibacterium flocculans TaxID=985250 RepID=A0A318E2Y3_9GAMM|nr:nucleotidyltransferase domain-containing protein [Sinimarinibacterium flocculans]PXV64305.1 hypothetical protein C8D93_11399 [Sinimarinibacterium flocculans]
MPAFLPPVPDPSNALSPAAVSEVRARLKQIATDHDVNVLHAIESGSRAWGFPSPDSDYDARFIYAHDADWYFSVHERRDVIETPIETVGGITFDVNGWDLRKALRLLAKSNPVLIEWLQSPIVYVSAASAKGHFASEMLELAGTFFSPKSAHYHYFHMARKNYREHLSGDSIKLKKYFYVLRPVLACLWVERGQGIPPMSLTQLLDDLLPSGSMRDDILELRERKMRTPEFGSGEPIPTIQRFLTAQIERLASIAQPEASRADPTTLDRFLRRWGSRT